MGMEVRGSWSLVQLAVFRVITKKGSETLV